MNSKIREAIKTYLSSPTKDPEKGLEILRMLQEEDEEAYNSVSETLVDLLPSSEVAELIDAGATNGYLALTKKEQEKLVEIVGSEERAKEMSYFEVMARLENKNLADISNELENMADRSKAVDYAYSLEKDLIDLEDLRVSLANGSDEEVKIFVDRYFEGSGYDDTDDNKKLIALGLGNRDMIGAEQIKENEKNVEKAIKRYEKDNLDVKFASLDLSAQNRILAEAYESLAEENKENVDWFFVDSLIKTNISSREKQKLIQRVLEEAKTSSLSIDMAIAVSGSLKSLLGIKQIDFKKTDLNRAVILGLDKKIFANLHNQIVKDRFDDTNVVVEAAKKRIIEKNIEKRLSFGITEPTSIPNPSAMDIDERRDFNYRVSLINRHIRENPESKVLKNILLNTHLVNEEAMIKEMVEMQDDLKKKREKLSLEELKQFLSVDVINQYFSENQNLKTIMLQVGANDLYLTFSEEVLNSKYISTLNKNKNLREEVIKFAFEKGRTREDVEKDIKKILSISGQIADSNYDNLLSKSANAVFVTDSGKIKPEKQKEIISATKSLQRESYLFKSLLYSDITEIVSYSSTSSDEEQSRFFGDIKQLKKPQNIKQAYERKQNVVFSLNRRWRRTACATSKYFGGTEKHIPINDIERERINQNHKRDIAIMTDKIRDLNTKVSGREYAELAKSILGDYYNKIYNSKNLVTKLIGQNVSSESPAIQQRDLIRGLGILMEQAEKRLNSYAKYISASHEVMSDPRFIDKLTLKNSAAVIGVNYDFSKFENLTLGKQKEKLDVLQKKQLELMNKEPEYKQYVEEFNKRNARYKEVVEEYEKLTERLEKLNSSSAKTNEAKKLIKTLKLSIEDTNKKLAILEPYMNEAKELKENFEKSYAEKQDKLAKKTMETTNVKADIFDYHDVIMKGSKTPLKPAENPKIAEQIRKLATDYISSMISNIERINSLFENLNVKQIVLKNTMLGTVVKQASLTIKTLKAEKQKLQSNLETLNDENSKEYQKLKKLYDSVDNHLSRVSADTKALENSLDKLGVAELKNKE